MKTNKMLEVMIKKHGKNKIKVTATKNLIKELNSNIKESIKIVIAN